MAAVSHDLLADLLPHVQDGVRVIGEYTETEYTITYLRPDVEATVTDEYADRIHEEVLLQDVSTPCLEEFYGVGLAVYDAVLRGGDGVPKTTVQ